MNVEIVSVGTEILLGDIVNTNAQFLGRELASIGMNVYRQEVIGDNTSRLLGIFEEAFIRSDIVITTGGLGPTVDDLTKETACEYFGMDLELHKESYEALIRIFNKVGKEITESNLKQAYFPKEAIVLKNPNGTAPGAILEKNNKIIVVLPGPPREMKPMFLNHVKEYLKQFGDGVIKSKMLRVLGIGEGQVADKIKDIMDNETSVTIAPYAKNEDVVFRVTAKSENEEGALAKIAPVEEKIKERLGLDCYAEGEDATIQQVVAKLLFDNNFKISVAESCTGGMIASRLVSIAGISKVFKESAVTYSNEAKINTLGVKNETLEKYTDVSEETAKEMALGIAKKTGADIAISTTGIAGPRGASESKPVGLVYIGLYYKGNVKVYRTVSTGNREVVIVKATVIALDMVRRTILKNELA